MAEVIFCPIPYPSYYADSDGNIWSANAHHKRWVKLRLRRHRETKYLSAALTRPICRDYLVHRLICEAFHGRAPEDKPFALHRNGDSKNNRQDNLYWGSGADNHLDMVRHGTKPRGENHKSSRLSDEDVKYIRTAVINGVGSCSAILAKKFKISQGHVWSIVNRKTWKHVK